MLAFVFNFSHVRDLCCTFSTASNDNNDMQGHMMRSKGMLIGVLVVSVKSRKTKKKKALGKSSQSSSPINWHYGLFPGKVSQNETLKIKNSRSIQWNKNKLMTVVLCFLVVLNVVGVTHAHTHTGGSAPLASVVTPAQPWHRRWLPRRRKQIRLGRQSLPGFHLKPRQTHQGSFCPFPAPPWWPPARCL